MKRIFQITIAIIIATLLNVMPAMARVAQMNDEALGSVTAQTGISISTSHLGFDIKADTIYYKDSDGIGPGTTAGFISFTNVSLKGSVDFATPMTIDLVTGKDKNGFTEITSVLMKISDMTLKIDSFYIDAIRLGSAAGKGASLGSFGIDNMVVKMTGGITIAATR